MEDQDAFERHFLQLKSYYTGTRTRTFTTRSTRSYLYKARCRARAVFHGGCLQPCAECTSAVSHETYVYFMGLLAKTVRDEIAGCSEKIDDSLSLTDAIKIFMFSTEQELQAYVLDVAYIVWIDYCAWYSKVLLTAADLQVLGPCEWFVQGRVCQAHKLRSGGDRDLFWGVG